MLNMNMELFIKSIWSTYQNHLNAFHIIVTISELLSKNFPGKFNCLAQEHRDDNLWLRFG